jgi:hypothetical protein
MIVAARSAKVSLKKRSRLRFGLRSAFVLITIFAWCAWQWSISERRTGVAQELEQMGLVAARDSVVKKSGVESLCTSMLWGEQINEPIRQSWLGALTGWDNWTGITVFVFSGQLDIPVREEQIRSLSRLPGLTTVVIWDADPHSEASAQVIEFRKALKSKLPNVEVQHVQVEPLPVG